jgi:hypothetical protein
LRIYPLTINGSKDPLQSKTAAIVSYHLFTISP